MVLEPHQLGFPRKSVKPRESLYPQYVINHQPCCLCNIRVITDHSNVSDYNVTPKDVERIAQLLIETSKIANRIYGVAVGPTEIMYGLARMWQAYADNDITGWHTLVVRTRKEAEDWLRSNLDKNLTFRNPEQDEPANTK